MDSNAAINLIGAMVGKDVPTLAFEIAVSIKRETPKMGWDGVFMMTKKLFEDTIPNFPRHLVGEISTAAACIYTGDMQYLENRNRSSPSGITAIAAEKEQQIKHFIEEFKKI